MVVIADTSPLNYLVLIDAVHILPALFGKVTIADAVLRELSAVGAPPEVRAWISAMPDWLSVKSAAIRLPDERLASLGAGEREVITLALEDPSEALLVMDEAKGRQEAAYRQLRFIGTLGVVDMAAARGLIDLLACIESLTRTNFHIAPGLLKVLLENDLQRRAGGQSTR
jgi:predicted nucleic acid-binding protein